MNPFFTGSLLALLPTVVLAAGPESPALELSSCQGSAPDGALCGSYSVFEDRQARKGRKIDLRVMVIPAEAEEPNREPLFLLAGGPGQAASVLAGFVGFLPEIHAVRDVVLVDQRGTGGSNRLGCEPDDVFGWIDVYLSGKLDADGLARCAASLDADPRLYTTPIAMDDLDEVRTALGYDKIHLFGGSYGTRAALVYLRRHPEHVATVTLRAAVPTYERVPLYFAKDAQRAIEDLFGDCRADESCSAAFPGIRGRLTRVLQKLAKKPVRVLHRAGGEEREVEITRATFSGGILFLLYHSAMASRIPQIVARADGGDFKPFLGAVVPFVQQLGPNISLGMFLSVICAEDLANVQRESIATATAGTFLGGWITEQLVDVCGAWPTGKLPDGYDDPVRAEVPVLILSGEVDPTAAPRMGEEIARTLPDSLHVVMPDTGHIPAFPGCTGELFQRFVNSGSLKGLDFSCVEELRRPPFAAGS